MKTKPSSNTREILIMALRKATTVDTAATKPAASAETTAQEVIESAQTQADTASVKEQQQESIQQAQEAAIDAAGWSPVDEAVVVEAAAEDEATDQPSTETAVAVVEQNTAVSVAPTKRGALSTFTQDLAEEGYEGLELTGMSFDRVKLHEADFKLGTDEISLGKEIYVQIMNTRPLYIVRQYPGNGAEIFYSYDKDGATLSDGSSSKDTLDKWKEDGYGTESDPLDIKQYVEAMAQLVNRDDEHDGAMVMLSIPPASRARLAGAFAIGKQRMKAAPSNLIIQCKVGNKIGSGEEAFRPWVFNAHSLAS